MMTLKRVFTLCFGLLALGVSGGFAVQEVAAGSITYTLTGHLTGSLGTTSFTDAAVLLTTVGDTANVTTGTYGPFALVQNADVTTISIDGVGTTALSGPYGMASISAGVVGIGRLDNYDGFSVLSSVYDGTSNYTVTGTFNGTTTTYQTTTLGDLIVTGVSGDGTFTAVVAAVPEPSSLALLALGGLGWAVRAIRRRQISLVA